MFIGHCNRTRFRDSFCLASVFEMIVYILTYLLTAADDTSSYSSAFVYMLSLFAMQTGCEDPTIQPSATCVTPGRTFTCTETSGHPAPPYYSFHYWAQNGSYQLTAGQSSYVVHQLGQHWLSCAVQYFHPRCPQYSAVCLANTSVAVMSQYRTSVNIITSYLRDVVSAVYATATWLAGWLGGWISHAGIVSKRLNLFYLSY